MRVALLAVLGGCAVPDPLGGAVWSCSEAGGDRLIGGEYVPCGPDGAWSISVPLEDGPGTFTESPGSGALPTVTDWPAAMSRVEPAAWSVVVPDYRCAGCDDQGAQDGLELACVARAADGVPGFEGLGVDAVFAHCGGADGGGTGWDLRLVP